MFMLPYPSSKYVPKLRGDYPDVGYLALTSKMDIHFLAMRAEVLELNYLIWPERCPDYFVDELGYWFASGLLKSDSLDQKRKKVQVSIETHKVRGEWAAHAKLLIDSIAGYDSRIVNDRAYKEALPLWVECDGVNNGGTKWSPEGVGTNSNYMGIMESCPGSGYEPGIAGMIYINCHYGVDTAVLSAQTVDQLAIALKADVVPAYYRCVLCYIDSSGVIQNYPGGTIN